MEATTWLAAISSDSNKAAIAAFIFLICGVGIASRFRGGDGGKGAAFVVYVDERSDQTRREGARKRWLWDSLNLLREGYAKYATKPWRVWTSEGYQVVIPPTHVEELKMLPDHTLPSSLAEFMLPQYTFQPFNPRKLLHVNSVILRDLNKNMANIFPAMRDEVDAALSLDFSDSTDWIEIDPAAKLLRLVSRISGRAFVGEELYRNEEWINISCSYTKDVFLSAIKLRAVPWLLRAPTAYLLPDLRRVYRHHERARALVQPILEQRIQDDKTGNNFVKPSDTVQWMYDSLPEQEKPDYAFQGVAQLAITAVSVQSTSKLLVNVVLNLMTYTEYVPILKQEIQDVLAKCGGKWTLESMAELEKLDSFMRESLRFEPPLTATFQRRALKNLELSDGTAYPEGSLLFAPSSAISFDSAIYPDPSTFDGLRFYELRQQAPKDGKVAAKFKQEFVATSKDFMQFGLGRHSCPGRWFASHLTKLVLVSLLLNYEFGFKEGETKLKTFLFQTTNMPNPKTRILVRKKV